MASDMYEYLKKQNVINKNGLVLRCGVDEITATRNAEQLKEYRQLEKNGKIFLSICKIGDPVWRIININKNDYYVTGPFAVEDVATKEIKFDDTWYRINDPMIFFDKDECWEMMDRIDNGEFEE